MTNRDPRWVSRELLEVETNEEDVRDRAGKHEPRSLTLTILAHPDLSRVGEIARLPFAPAAISRVTPELAPVGSDDAFPLADPLISRSPIALTPSPDGALYVERAGEASPLSIDGVRVDSTMKIEAPRLASGVILLLADRVALHLSAGEAGSFAAEKFGLVGESQAIQQVRGEIQRIAQVDVAVLIRGETGTGKELVARAIHDAGPRAKGPYISVNVPALPATLAASELFGHAKGAFTGAEVPREGYFARAHGGTLFLDEIGEMPSEVQAMLLRALETGVVQRLGDGLEQKVDVRLIAATDADLELLAERGEFRAALLHRMRGYEVHVAPLRERREDIGRILIHTLREELERAGAPELLEPGAPTEPCWLSAGVVARLALYDWPGNVRQLRNVARFIALSHRDRPVRISAELERLIAPKKHADPVEAEEKNPPARRKPSTLSEEELADALVKNHWRLKPTAEQLGLSRGSLYMLIDRYPNIRAAKDLSEAELRARVEAGADLAALSAELGVDLEVLKLRLKSGD